MNTDRAPSIMTRISGTAVPRKTQPTMALLEASRGRYARVVVAALGPAEPVRVIVKARPTM